MAIKFTTKETKVEVTRSKDVRKPSAEEAAAKQTAATADADLFETGTKAPAKKSRK